MSVKKDFEIAIIGGGIAGASLAIALLNRNIRIQIYEQGHAFSEIGAGVAFGPNSVRAMDACHSSLRDAFEKVATHNQWPGKKNVYFEFQDGRPDANGGDRTETVFALHNEQGQNAVHRAHFLDEVSKLIPKEICHFRKHLDDIVEDEKSGKLKMTFHDGTSAEADAVIGCDGIKSRTRALVVGETHPSAKAKYTHMYGYRGVIPMDKAAEVLGEERAANGGLWMGPYGHLLSFPVDGGATYNLFAAVYDPNEWPSEDRLTLPAKREDAMKDFDKFGPAVKKRFEMVEDNLDRWALFDLGDDPVPFFNKRRIVLLGDAAHATTPHHGAGAGFCIEDAAVMAAILADDRVKTARDLESVFAAFDASRRPRGHWLVQSSRRATELYDMRAEGVGDDLKKIEKELRDRFETVWNYDLSKAIEEAKGDLGKRLEETKIS
ncbi:salicylate 1-monooxygenase sala [Xylariales sp. AK1849]|nr:salicylate 1-monooxygenase sala [Xylariales sp. AK1849]